MNIYVSNIPFSLDEEGLFQTFAEYGTVNSAKIITDKFTGKSRGFGFVEMENDDEAQNAISNLNEAEVNGRELQVKEALPKPDNNSYNNRDRGNSGGRRDNNKRY
jgi:RNA recognition motif-containing protein